MSRVWGRALSDDDISVVRDLYASGNYILADIAKKFSVGVTTIWKVVNGLSYQDVIEGKKPRGQAALVTDEQVIEMREIWARNMTQKDIALKYGLTLDTVRRILNSNTWAYLPSVEDIRKAMGKNDG